jgi:hypothetical protein
MGRRGMSSRGEARGGGGWTGGWPGLHHDGEALADMAATSEALLGAVALTTRWSRPTHEVEVAPAGRAAARVLEARWLDGGSARRRCSAERRRRSVRCEGLRGDKISCPQLLDKGGNDCGHRSEQGGIEAALSAHWLARQPEWSGGDIPCDTVALGTLVLWHSNGRAGWASAR